MSHSQAVSEALVFHSGVPFSGSYGNSTITVKQSFCGGISTSPFDLPDWYTAAFNFLVPATISTERRLHKRASCLLVSWWPRKHTEGHGNISS